MIDRTTAILLISWFLGSVVISAAFFLDNKKLLIIGFCWFVGPPVIFIMFLVGALLYTAITGVVII